MSRRGSKKTPGPAASATRNRPGGEAADRAQRTRTLPKSGYREYTERCQRSGRRPEDFTTYLEHARRWRAEYDAAKERGDLTLVRELEDLLCERRSASSPAHWPRNG